MIRNCFLILIYNYAPFKNIYLFVMELPKSCQREVGAHQSPKKKERKVRRVKKIKWIKVQRVKHPTPSRLTDALIGDEEQNGK